MFAANAVTFSINDFDEWIPDDGRLFLDMRAWGGLGDGAAGLGISRSLLLFFLLFLEGGVKEPGKVMEQAFYYRNAANPASLSIVAMSH